MNIFVFVFDSLRADFVSTLEGHETLTPHIDRVASDGVSFSQAFSQGIWTAPSAGSIFTSRYPETHGANLMHQQLTQNSESVATTLRQAGMSTGCISSSAVVSADRGYDRGFEDFIELFNEVSVETPSLPAAVSDKTIDWIRSHTDEEFFLLVWSNGTHTPYATPNTGDYAIEGTNQSLRSAPREASETVRKLYKDLIRYNDQEFGRIIDQLKDVGLYDESLIVVLSDHGEVFDEHGRIEKTRPSIKKVLERFVPKNIQKYNQLFRPYAWVGHQCILPYDELLHVPLIMKFPGSRPPSSSSSNQLVQLIDVAPTLLEYVDLDIPQSMQGTSLLPTIRDNKKINSHVYSSSTTIKGNIWYHSVRDSNYKYIRTERIPLTRSDLDEPLRTTQTLIQQMIQPTEFLFNVKTGENDNLIDEHPSVAERMRDVCNSWQSENQRYREDDSQVTKDELSAEAEDHLRDLGYLS